MTRIKKCEVEFYLDFINGAISSPDLHIELGYQYNYYTLNLYRENYLINNIYGGTLRECYYFILGLSRLISEGYVK